MTALPFMASHSPVNTILSLTVVIRDEGEQVRATCPQLPGLCLIGPGEGVLTDIDVVLAAMLAEMLLRPVNVHLTAEVPLEASHDTRLLLYEAEVG